MKRNPWEPHPDRLIWNNNGTYWMRWAPFDPIIKHPRIAASLNTKDIEEARRRRDAFINDWSRKEPE